MPQIPKAQFSLGSFAVSTLERVYYRPAELEYLEETEASGVEAVFSFAILQREELYELLNELRVREIFKDDLFTLRDTEERRVTAVEVATHACERRRAVCRHKVEHAPRSSPRTASHLLYFRKLRGSSFL